MKWVLNIVGILLILMGTIWILQGTGILPVGGMAYQTKWAYVGIIVDLLAIAVFIFANRRRKRIS